MKDQQDMTGRQAVLAAALPHVPFDGWTEAVAERARTEAGMTRLEYTRLFPDGVASLLDFFVAEADRRMTEEAKNHEGFTSLKLRQKIEALVRIRLEQQAPYREAVRRGVAFYAMPPHALRSLNSLYRTVDVIWHAAGDTSTDFSYYTKRMTLAGVYSSTLLYWLSDESEGHAETWAFLARRINDVMKINKLKATMRNCVERFAILPPVFRRTG